MCRHKLTFIVYNGGLCRSFFGTFTCVVRRFWRSVSSGRRNWPMGSRACRRPGYLSCTSRSHSGEERGREVMGGGMRSEG